MAPSYKDDAGNLVVPCVIDGKPIIQSSSANFPVISARTQETLHYGQSASVEIANEAIESSWNAFKTYKKTTVEQRRSWLLKAAELFKNITEEARDRQVEETSASAFMTNMNAQGMQKTVMETATAIRTALTGELPPTSDGCIQLVQREPVGPVLMIMPWNGALFLVVRGISCALAAGSTVVLKASELCPWTHSLLVQTFLDAGFPAGSVNLIMSDRSQAAEITESIISNPKLRKIEFIGSENVGKAVGAMAAKYLKPLIMELGDQSPAIILDDANLSKAASICAHGALAHHGQLCFSTERIIVQSNVKEKFCELFVEAMKAQNGAGYAAANRFAEQSKAIVDDALQKGAKLLYGNNELTSNAALSPTILIDVPADARIHANESFSPSVFITVVNTDEEAITEANSRDGGLSAAVFTGSHERGLKIANELEFGEVQINKSTVYSDAAGPLAGWKASGWGDHGGKYGIGLFLQTRAVHIYPSE